MDRGFPPQRLLDDIIDERGVVSKFGSLLGMGGIPHFYEYLSNVEAQRSRTRPCNDDGSESGCCSLCAFGTGLPPSPEDYEGKYLGSVPGGQIALSIGRSAQGSLGAPVLYVLAHEGMGWPPRPRNVAWTAGFSPLNSMTFSAAATTRATWRRRSLRRSGARRRGHAA